MPEATYIPLDGSSNRSCGWWTSLTGLEKGLIFLSLILAIFVFALTVALVSCKGEEPVEPTTTSTTTTTTTTEKPTDPPTTISSSTTTTTTEKPTTPTTKPPAVRTISVAPTSNPPPVTQQNVETTS